MRKLPLVNHKLSQNVKLPPEAGASREGNDVLIVPLDPAYPALAGRGTCRPRNSIKEGDESKKKGACLSPAGTEEFFPFPN
jgi:hypothetical protein